MNKIVTILGDSIARGLMYDMATSKYTICRDTFMNALSAKGYKIGIVSWTSKGGSDNFNADVARVKKEWLAKHLPSVEFAEIVIIPYGTPKSSVGSGILFDDEIGNRTEWKGTAYGVENIAKVLATL